MRLRFIFSLIACSLVILACKQGEFADKRTKGGVGVSIDIVNEVLRGQNSSNAQGAIGDNGETEKTYSALIAPCVDTVLPIIQENCAQCHNGGVSKDFKTTDEEAACNLFLEEGGKVVLKAPNVSNFVRRMEQNHNCWLNDAAKCSDEMLGAIESWAEQVPPELIPELDQSEGLTLASAIEPTTDNNVPTTDVIAEAESAVLAGNMQMEMDVNAVGENQIYVPANMVGTCNNNNPDAVTETATFTFNIQIPGTYYLCGRYSAPSGAMNSFFYSVDGSPFEIWGMIVNAEHAIGRATVDIGGNTPRDPFELTGGTHTLELRCREAGTRMDQIGFSQNGECQYNAVPEDTSKELVYDMANFCGGTEAKLRILVEDISAESVAFRCPRIESASPLKIKGLNIFVNRVLSQSNATYKGLDMTVSANSTECLAPGFMQVLKVNPPNEEGMPTDEWGFSLDECSVAP